MTDKITIERALLQQALTALADTIKWRKTGFGRPPEQTAQDAIEALREALAAPQRQPRPFRECEDSQAGQAQVLQPEQPAEPTYCDPSCVTYGLAEMILSDCGHSSNNQRILDRVAERIDRHIEAIQAPQQAKPADQSCYCLNCEALGKELAALQPAQPAEPVAYRAWFDADSGARWLFTLWPEEERLDVRWEPLYTHPAPAQPPLNNEQSVSNADKLPNGFVPLQKQNGKVVFAACMDSNSRHYKWLMWQHPDGQWVSKCKLKDWELMQVEDQQHYGIVQEAAHGIAAPRPPPAQQPLTEAQYMAALGPLRNEIVCSAGTLRKIVRAIEAAQGIKKGAA